jgi:hypothetical protein
MCCTTWRDPEYEKMTPEQREAYVARWNASMREFWEDVEAGKRLRRQAAEDKS